MSLSGIADRRLIIRCSLFSLFIKGVVAGSWLVSDVGWTSRLNGANVKLMYGREARWNAVAHRGQE